jgi:hypothetical protein
MQRIEVCMIKNQHYKERWDQLRGIYRSLIWLPVLALAILPLLALGLDVLAGAPFFIGWVVFIVRYAAFRCPRCEKPFWWTWLYRNPFTTDCVHCHLPKWALVDEAGQVIEHPSRWSARDYKDDFKPENRP